MKISSLYGIVACITSIVTLLVFLDFQKQWKNAKTFQEVIHNLPLTMRCLFISPEELGVEAWEIGDYAAYQSKTNLSNKQISFYVATQNVKPSQHHWLRMEGLMSFKGVNIDLWSYREVKSIRFGGENPEVIFTNKAIPFFLPTRRKPSYPVILEKIGEENLETSIGILKCQHYFVYICSPDGSYEPFMEIWGNSAIRPLGIVRARWQDEVIDLVRIRTRYSVKIPDMLSNIINVPPSKTDKLKFQHSSSVCTQCHHEKLGGKELKLEALTSLSGVELELTQSLHHYYAANLARPDNRMSFQLISHQGKQLASEPIRFTWAKGSFRIKTDPVGQLYLRLDEGMSQGNVRVSTQKGRLVLNPFTESNR